jgi:hypothetical protein
MLKEHTYKHTSYLLPSTWDTTSFRLTCPQLRPQKLTTDNVFICCYRLRTQNALNVSAFRFVRQ